MCVCSSQAPDFSPRPLPRHVSPLVTISLFLKSAETPLFRISLDKGPLTCRGWKTEVGCGEGEWYSTSSTCSAAMTQTPFSHRSSAFLCSQTPQQGLAACLLRVLVFSSSTRVTGALAAPVTETCGSSSGRGTKRGVRPPSSSQSTSAVPTPPVAFSLTDFNRVNRRCHTPRGFLLVGHLLW